MTLLQLQYFKTLATLLNYTKAAQSLHISQPSLSYSISELEKEFQVQLFIRDKRQVKLSKYGLAFLPYVDKVLTTLEESKQKLASIARENKSIINLGYICSISDSVIPELIQKFKQDEINRKISISFVEELSSSIVKKLLDDEIDLGFFAHQNEELEALPVCYQNLYLAVAQNHHLANRKKVELQDFVNEPLVVLGKSSNLRALEENLFLAAGKKPNIAYEFQETHATLQFVAMGMGVAVTPHFPGNYGWPVKFIQLQVKQKDFKRIIYLGWHKNRDLSPTVLEMKDFLLKKVFPQSSEGLANLVTIK